MLPYPHRAPPCRAAPIAVAAVLLVGCAAAPPRTEPPPAPAQALVEILPGDAELQVDGVVVGRGGRVLTLPDPGRTYRIRASAPGFESAERADAGAQLAGGRVALVLRPTGTPGAGPLDAEDGPALASAAETLARQGRRAAAIEYARRAAAVDPEAPAVRRVVEQIGGGADRSIEVRTAGPGGQR